MKKITFILSYIKGGFAAFLTEPPIIYPSEELKKQFMKKFDVPEYEHRHATIMRIFLESEKRIANLEKTIIKLEKMIYE